MTEAQILHGGGAVRPSCHLQRTVAICIFDQERGAGYRLGGSSASNFQMVRVRTDLVFHYQLTGLAGEELHMVLARIKNMGQKRWMFLDGQHTQIHIADLNDSVAVRYAVEVTGAILHIGDPERNTLSGVPSADSLMITGVGLIVLVNTCSAFSLGSRWMMRWASSMI